MGGARWWCCRSCATRARVDVRGTPFSYQAETQRQAYCRGHGQSHAAQRGSQVARPRQMPDAPMASSQWGTEAEDLTFASRQTCRGQTAVKTGGAEVGGRSGLTRNVRIRQLEKSEGQTALQVKRGLGIAFCTPPTPPGRWPPAGPLRLQPRWTRGQKHWRRRCRPVNLDWVSHLAVFLSLGPCLPTAGRLQWHLSVVGCARVLPENPS